MCLLFRRKSKTQYDVKANFKFLVSSNFLSSTSQVVVSTGKCCHSSSANEFFLNIHDSFTFEIHTYTYTQAHISYDGLKESCLYRFMYLNVWYPVGALVRKDQEVWPSFRKCVTGVPGPVFCSLSVYNLWIRCKLSETDPVSCLTALVLPAKMFID